MPKFRTILCQAVLAAALFASLASTDTNEASLASDEPAPAPVVNSDANAAAGGDAGAAGGDEGAAGGESPGPGGVFAVGDLVELGSWQVQVHGVTDPVVSTNEFLQPAEGFRWVGIDVEVTNLGDQAETVSSLLCFELMDDQNIAYSQTITAETNAASPDGEVAAGASRRGTIEYEVPATATGLRLNFQCDLFSSGTATIAL